MNSKTMQTQTSITKTANQQISFAAWVEDYKSGSATISRIVGKVEDDYSQKSNRIAAKKKKGLSATREERQELQRAYDVFQLAARHNKILLYLEQTETTFINLIAKPDRKDWGSLVETVATLACMDGYRPAV